MYSRIGCEIYLTSSKQLMVLIAVIGQLEIMLMTISLVKLTPQESGIILNGGSLYTFCVKLLLVVACGHI